MPIRAGSIYQNSGFGSETQTYGVRCWASWHSNGTVYASNGVSSISVPQSARYRMNFSTSMSNYAFAGGAGYNTGSWGTGMSVMCLSQNNGSYSSSYVELSCCYQNGGVHQNPVNTAFAVR